MLGSIIKISKLIFAIFALRICASFRDIRYINARRDSLSNGESRFFIPILSRSKFLTLEQGKYSKISPYVFTEQGIYMLMTVLKGEQAAAQSKALIRLFKQMKDCIVQNQQLIGNAVRSQS